MGPDGKMRDLPSWDTAGGRWDNYEEEIAE